MKFLPSNELVGLLQWRYAVKAFDATRKIEPALWADLQTALQLTPSSYGLQPWKFLVVQNPELRSRLRAVSWNQKQVTDSSHFVVLAQQETMTEAHIDRYVLAVAETRGLPIAQLQGMRKTIVGDVITGPRAQVVQEWMARQSYIALGNFMTAAAMVGVDTCPLEGLDPVQYDQILSLTGTGFRTVMACAAGYRSSDDRLATAPKVRYPQNELFAHL